MFTIDYHVGTGKTCESGATAVAHGLYTSLICRAHTLRSAGEAYLYSPVGAGAVAQFWKLRRRPEQNQNSILSTVTTSGLRYSMRARPTNASTNWGLHRYTGELAYTLLLRSVKTAQVTSPADRSVCARQYADRNFGFCCLQILVFCCLHCWG